MQHDVTNSRIQPAQPAVSVIPNPVVRWPEEEMQRPLLSDAVPVERTTISNTAALAIRASNLAAVSAVGHARNRGTHMHIEDRVSSSFNTVRRPTPHAQSPNPHGQGAGRNQERKDMPSKGLFSKFRRHEQVATEVSDHAASLEVSMNELEVETAASPNHPQGVLLSCEDIYHASGILSPHAKYSITKIAEMLGSVHIRDLSKEVKRASMLMARCSRHPG
jgi:hypothetical protein